MIRILLVDGHASSREALGSLLERQDDMRVVGQAGTLADAVTKLRGVDIALIELRLPDGDGNIMIRELKRLNPAAEALVLTGAVIRQEHARAIEAGAAGVLLKTVGIDEITTAIRKLHRGEPLYTPGDLAELLRCAAQRLEQEEHARRRLGQLTPRERELLQALADGLSDREIAERLSLSVRTIHTHMTHLLAKLEVDSRLQALLLAVRYGEVRLDLG